MDLMIMQDTFFYCKLEETHPLWQQGLSSLLPNQHPAERRGVFNSSLAVHPFISPPGQGGMVRHLV
jgi:hypothetical protein